MITSNVIYFYCLVYTRWNVRSSLIRYTEARPLDRGCCKVPNYVDFNGTNEVASARCHENM